MKLSAFMKKEMDHIRDEYLFDAADTGKKLHAAPMYILPSNESSPIEKLKKIVSVAACVVLAVAVIVAFILMRNSISPGGDDPADSETETGTGNTAASDNIYSSRFLFDDLAYYSINGGHLMFSTLDEIDTAYFACTNPLCRHNDDSCPAHSNIIQYTLVVPREDSPLPLVYMFGRRPEREYADGEWIDRPSEEVINLGRIKVFDPATNESRILAETDFAQVSDAWYYDGKIYMSVLYYSDYSGAPYRVGVLDTETGEWNEIDNGEVFAEGIGISEERFYYITNRGLVYSCDLNLGDIREEYNCGISQLRKDSITLSAFVDNGMLYFEKNCRVPDEMVNDDMGDYLMISDVYTVDLNNMTAGEKLIAEGVRVFKPYGGDLYYTLWDYENIGTLLCDDDCVRDIVSMDGGTLYRYDKKTGESTACFTDIGTNFDRIYDINDEHVIFEGIQYKDLENYNTKDSYDSKYFYNYLCVSNINTGEWHVVYHTFDPSGVFQ